MPDQCSSCFFGQLPHQELTRVCRHTSPVPINKGAGLEPVLWPPVEDTDWCGDGVDAATMRPFATIIEGPVVLVANLPTTPPPGTRMFVSDGQNTNFGTTVSGSGKNVIPVYWDDSTSVWRIG